MSIERNDPVLAGDEKATLLGFLDYHRATLQVKCFGLTDEQLARRSVPPSNLSLLGLVRHIAKVEQIWFHRLAGERFQRLYETPEDPDADFTEAAADPDLVKQAWQDWADQVSYARAVVRDLPLDRTFTRIDRNETTPMSLRFLLTHMIEEYSRHNGHADLLREVIDGSVGE